MTHRSGTLVASAAVLLALSAACGFPVGEDESAHEPSPSPVEPPPSTPPPLPVEAPAPAPPPGPTLSVAEQQSRKVSDFVQYCANRFDESVRRSRERYVGWVSEGGPTGRERYISRGVMTISRPSRCRQTVDALASQPPSMPTFEAQASEYAGALEALYAVLQQADTYYERGSYRDDAAAGGRELHPRLMAAWEQFAAVQGPLDTALDRIQREARAARLARLADDPSGRARFLVERTMGEARDILDVTAAMEVQGGRLVTPDPDAFVALVQTFQAHVDEMRAHRPTPEEPRVDLSRVREAANELLTSSLGLMRRVRDQTRFSRSEQRRLGTAAGWMTDGSPDEVVQDYNRLVDAYNRLRYR